MARPIATTSEVERDALLDFARTRHHLVLVSTRKNGMPQVSPVTGGVDADGRFVISSYPERAKSRNARRHPEVSVLVLSDDFGGAWVQVDGTCEVLDVPEARDAFVDYYRCISGSPGMSADHPGLGSWGRRRVMGPQESITRASAAWAEWNP